MAKGLTDDELKAITDQEMRAAVGFWSGRLAMQRQKAMVYYLGEAKLDLTPPEIEGRSSVVSPDVRNTIESMLPQLMVKFSGSDRVVEFEANKPGDEKAAEQATDYVNYIYHVRNAGERISYNWMKDALLSKNGIIKVWWDDRHETKREEYNGLSDVELSQLMDDDEIEVTEQKSYPDEDDVEKRQEAISQLMAQGQQAQQAAMQGDQQAAQALQQIAQQMQQIEATPPVLLYDVVCKRTKEGGKVCVENVPPEEFLISRKAKSIQDASFVGHRVARSRSDLKSMGYKNVDAISGDDQSANFNLERVQRLQFDDEMAYLNADQITSSDESQQMVSVTECYIRCDFDGDGISELRKVVRAGNQLLENEVVDCAPFVSITPIPMPHKFFGLSVADLALEGQRINTSMLRGVLDNTYLQINGRYFAVDGQVNLDDLLASRPGGVVRMKQAGMAGRLDQGSGDSQLGLTMLEYMKGFQEDSTGWSRNSAGTDVNALNSPVTATQATIVTNKADMRTDLIARNFAEGFRDLFRMILKLCSQYGAKRDVVKLRGEWAEVAPRDWRNGFETTVNVGLGTGNKDQNLAHLNILLQQAMAGLQDGTATPENLYQIKAEIVKGMGFKSADKYVTDPSKVPPKPPAPGPMELEQVKGQVATQVEQIKAQAHKDVEQFKAQMQAQVDQNRQAVEAQQKEMQMRNDMEREQFMASLKEQADAKDRELKRYVAELQSQTSILIEQMRLGQKREADAMGMQKHADARQDAAMFSQQEANDNDA
jgi:hypothetical protein